MNSRLYDTVGFIADIIAIISFINMNRIYEFLIQNYWLIPIVIMVEVFAVTFIIEKISDGFEFAVSGITKQFGNEAHKHPATGIWLFIMSLGCYYLILEQVITFDLREIFQSDILYWFNSAVVWATILLDFLCGGYYSFKRICCNKKYLQWNTLQKLFPVILLIGITLLEILLVISWYVCL